MHARDRQRRASVTEASIPSALSESNKQGRDPSSTRDSIKETLLNTQKSNRISRQQNHVHQKNDSERDIVPNTTTSKPSPVRPSMVDASSSLVATLGLQDHLTQAAHAAQVLQDKNQDLESENRKLKELIRQHHTSALDWCSHAKIYQMERNFMTNRLAELELQIAKKSTKEAVHQQLAKPSISNVSTISTSHWNDQESMEKRYEAESPALTNFVSQSISQILDDMTQSKTSKEPNLPPLSKGNYSIGNDNSVDTKASSTSTSATNMPKSALKSAAKPSTCTCGCQEELRFWKSRCQYAENQVVIQEMRCERSAIKLDGYKAKWNRYREQIIREQYQHRMRMAISAQQQPQQQPQPQQQQQGLDPGHVQMNSMKRERSKRTRFGTEDSETSQKRRETTQKNTLHNQFNARLPSRRRSSADSPFNNSCPSGSGSAAQPQMLFEDVERGSSSDDGDHGLAGMRRNDEHVQELGDKDTPADYGSQQLSLTFPSDLALRRRQGFSDLEDDDDSQDNGHQPLTMADGKRSSTRSFESVSPTTRASQTRSLKRPIYTSHNTNQQQQLATSASIDNRRLSFASDQSSQPMFTSTDYLQNAAHARTPKAHAEAEIGLKAESAGVTPEQRRVFVPETPLELQGLTPNKNHSPRNPVDEDGSRTAKGHTKGSITIDVTDDQLSDTLPEPEDADKENKEPTRKRGPEVLVMSDKSSGDKSAHHERDSINDQQHRNQGGGGASDVPEERVYNFTERRKDKRKQMHGQDCACCRRFYEITGPLPLPDGYNKFFTPAPRPGEKEEWEKSSEERLQQRIQDVSRHRVHHEDLLTPPGFWDTDFPPTQDRLEWDRIAEERRQRKRARDEYLELQEQQRQQTQQQRQRQQQSASSSSSKRVMYHSDGNGESGIGGDGSARREGPSSTGR
ncbi:hypothetical protein BG011_009139 [Mortierella polycephala]|uniref:DNA endonuclease activator Ctp1 C-terminal domain-containing protein n=1 Tax=Mortierella polycephala TaxID=41804 RepID=A0A9P6U9Z9_9FUNG|nr:hypothetical protein BG011_009139 [Mortierella polycephala]